MNGRGVYELLAERLGWKRPDGSPIPKWSELSLSAQGKCDAFVDVILCFKQQRQYGD